MSKFNPISQSKRLKESGMPKEQAEILAEEFSEVIDNILATKHEVIRLDRELKNVELRLDNKIDRVEAVLSAKIDAVDTKLNWLMSLVGVMGVLLTLSNILHNYLFK